LLVEDIVENIGLVFGDEVPMYRRAIAIADILTEVSPGKWLKAVRKADDVYDVLKANRTGRQKRLKEIANDPKASSADRGWIRNEQRQIEQGNRDTVRNPPGKELAHERGREAAKGYGYEHSNLQDKDLHRLQHKYDDFGRANKERPVE